MAMFRLTVVDDRGVVQNDVVQEAKSVRSAERQARAWADEQTSRRATECVVYKLTDRREVEAFRFILERVCPVCGCKPCPQERDACVRALEVLR